MAKTRTVEIDGKPVQIRALSLEKTLEFLENGTWKSVPLGAAAFIAKREVYDAGVKVVKAVLSESAPELAARSDLMKILDLETAAEIVCAAIAISGLERKDAAKGEAASP